MTRKKSTNTGDKRHEVNATDEINLGGMSEADKAEFDKQRKADEEKLKALMARQKQVKGKQQIITKPRDPNVIRGIAGDDPIRCVAKRKIGLDNDETSDVGETLNIAKVFAQRLQEAGAISIEL